MAGRPRRRIRTVSPRPPSATCSCPRWTIVPWDALCELIEPHHPNRATAPARGTAAHAAHVLRAALVQPGRRGVRRSAAGQAPRCAASWASTCERVPDGTTAEVSPRRDKRLGRKTFAAVGQVLQARGLKLAPAPSWTPPSSAHPARTKKRRQARDPEMHQTRKGSAVVLRHEAAHRGGQPHGAGAQRRGHPQPTCTTSTAARICCTAPSGASMATAPTPARSR